MTETLTFHNDVASLPICDKLLFIGRQSTLSSPAVLELLPPNLSRGAWENIIKSSKAGDDGRVTTAWTGGHPTRVSAGVLPEPCSRHNTPSRAWAVPPIVSACRGAGSLGIIICPETAAHGYALGIGVARALPTFQARTKRRESDVHVAFLDAHDGPVTDIARIGVTADAVRRAAHLVDAPPNELDTRRFLEEAQRIAARLDAVSFQAVVGDDLRQQGFGGLWGVGKASLSPPALVVLDYDGSGQSKAHDIWLGKGIVYDTGGLSIKGKTSMPGMKNDMAGAAAVLAAFEAAARLGLPHRLTAVLCLAENSVGPGSTRPDDILRMYSGRTVEVNNTDAEGRLVLADGVAWALRHRSPTRMVDLATLTGAQAISTGKRHAALYCNNDDLEAAAVVAGKRSGDLVHPLPFCPEFFRREFQSQVADMRNSVKDRSNGQSSCAGEFIRQHMGDSHVPWLHVDMAAPSHRQGRGTGWGVGFLLTLAGVGA